MQDTTKKVQAVTASLRSENVDAWLEDIATCLAYASIATRLGKPGQTEQAYRNALALATEAGHHLNALGPSASAERTEAVQNAISYCRNRLNQSKA